MTMLFPDLGNAATLQKKLSLIEKREIDGAALQFPGHLEVLSSFLFHRIRGKTVFLEQERQERTSDMNAALLAGLYSMNASFCYVIDSFNDHIEVHLGSRSANKQAGDTLHVGMLQGILGKENILADGNAGGRVRGLSSLPFCGAVTGIASAPPPSQSGIISPSDKWLRALQGERWTYILSGFYIQRKLVAEYEELLIAEIARLRGRPIRDDLLYEDKRYAEHYQNLLEAQLKRLEQGSLGGIWQTGVYFFAESENAVRRGLGLICSQYGGKKSVVQPVRAHICYKNKELESSFSDLLTSAEAAIYLAMPEEESPGYSINRVARFDSDHYGKKRPNDLEMGQIIRNSATTQNGLTVDIASLTKHCLVSGVTGSGKTNTCMSILRQLQLTGIPFLVIEPAKSEYRQLLNDALFKELRIFTLGDETPNSSSPFRINPFEVPEGVLIQTHLDYLKSLFRASFVMYAPMPYVLEEALYEIYRDKGWNLSSNSNPRGKGDYSFPTLTDLYEEIESVVRRIGYDDRISKDILAGLRTRINNLRLGAKGLMLDSHFSIPIEHILERPTILELKKIGNDDEKAFIIGLILTRVYEYFESKGYSDSDGLKHFMVIEEAHRLLKYVPEGEPESDGNLRAKAIETFSNMLSEIRAYGEGICVAEQIPAKLARDVIKNTNLKIMQRLVSKDDRDIVGDAMNLTEEQKKYAATLPKGSAIVFSEGMDGAFLVAVPDIKTALARAMDDGSVSSHMQSSYFRAYPGTLLKYKECEACKAGSDQCEVYKEIIKGIVVSKTAKEHFNRIFMTAIFSDSVPDIKDDIDRMFLDKLQISERDELLNVRRCFILHSSYLAFEGQGCFYGYPYEQLGKIISGFNEYMNALITGTTLEGISHKRIKEGVIKIRARPEEPFAGCYNCDKVCSYRYEIGRFLNDRRLNSSYNYILSNIKGDNKMWEELALLCKEVAGRSIYTNDAVIIRNLGLCYMSQKVSSSGRPASIQKKIIRNIGEVFDSGALGMEK